MSAPFNPEEVEKRLRHLAAMDHGGAISYVRGLPDGEETDRLEGILRDLIGNEAMYPQRGPQEMALRSDADVTIFGGAAGGGKTWLAQFLPVQWLLDDSLKGWTAIYYRKSRPEIVAPGGLWEECQRMWGQFGARFRELPLDCYFPNGNRVKFEQLYNESPQVLTERVKGAQLSFYVLEECTGFRLETALAVMSRNRSPVPGFKSRGFWTCNPDRDSWVFIFVRPWVDPEFPLQAAHGQKLYFRRFHDGEYSEEVAPYVLQVDGDQVWVSEDCPHALSITYIGADLSDNKVLQASDPSYRAKLEAQDPVQKARLLKSDWLISYGGGTMFSRKWFSAFQMEEWYVKDLEVRSWDLAVTKDGGDYTVGARVSRWYPKATAPPSCGNEPVYVIEDIIEGQWSEADVQQLIYNTAVLDGKEVRVILQEGKGDAGKLLIEAYRRYLPRETPLVAYRITGDKVVRAKPYSGLASRRRVFCRPAKWNRRFLQQHDKFPEVPNDDIVDSVSVAILHLDKGYGRVRLAFGTPIKGSSHGLPQW